VSRVFTRLRRRLTGEGGFTLIELLVTLVILSIVLAGITGLFSSGLRAETEVAFRAQSQSQARNALSYLRQETHCAKGASLPAASGSPPVQTLTLNLPTGCFRPSGETAGTDSRWCTVYVSAFRYQLWRQSAVAGCGSANGKLYADYLTAGDSVFSYTAPGTELGKVGVVFVVDTNSQSVSPNAYRLIDDIVMRNTTRS
jgi:prepilin-type N-terminal cleavage/methylation domain-containing protein